MSESEDWNEVYGRKIRLLNATLDRRAEMLRRTMNWLSGTDLLKEIREELGHDS